MVKEGGIWCFSTLLTIWCKNFRSASFWAPTGIFTLPVVFIRWTKPKRRKRLSTQDFPNLRWFFSRVGIVLLVPLLSLLLWHTFERVGRCCFQVNMDVIFYLSLVTLFKSTNRAFIYLFPCSYCRRGIVNACIFSNWETVFIRVNFVCVTCFTWFLAYSWIYHFVIDSSQAYGVKKP